MSRFLLALTSFLLLGVPARAQSEIVIRNSFEDADVFPFEILADQGGLLEFKDLPHDSSTWQAASAANLNLGYTHVSYWLRFRISNQAEKLEHVFLEVSYPLHDRLEIHIPDSQGRYQRTLVGDSFPFDERPIRKHGFCLSWISMK